MPVRSVKIGETQVDDRGRLVIPADLRKVLGLPQGERLEIHRLEGALDVFGESVYIAVPTDRKRGLFLISYAPVDKDRLIAVMDSWAVNYEQIRLLAQPTSKSE
jgi:AbrB family looped-hinge helix DNA binding protein